MTKKKFFLVSLLMVMLPLIGAYVGATAGVVPLQVGIEDPSNGQTNPNRTPTLIPEVFIDDYTLTFDDSCIGCEL